MALKMKIKIDLSGWYATSARVKRAIRSLRPWEIGPKDDLNLNKARDSFDRGDNTYPVSEEVIARGSQLIANGLKVVAKTSETSIDKPMLAFGRAALANIKRNIRGGAVEGPARSEAWVRRKIAAGVGDINMIGLTRGKAKFVNSLDVWLAGKAA